MTLSVETQHHSSFTLLTCCCQVVMWVKVQSGEQDFAASFMMQSCK